ncbi:MAG TPA: prepilin-type N-terminal cleavage/methylation domain-containing protein [Bryobacteraceae bacterium]|nr:prepilin-type N-terminal cleavage/methylation domain-containing protein [Bryobacteraceae bacterium]
MPTLSVGRRSSQSGVTLIELLIVMTIVALLAGLTYPSAVAGLDAIRLRSAESQVASFLNTAMDRAERRQQAVELRIAPQENALGARSADSSFAAVMNLPDSVAIALIEPALVNAEGQNQPRRFLLYPGGALPKISITLVTRDGRQRRVTVDPITGLPRVETVVK